MTDREKVIKGLKCCCSTGMCFDECPYHETSQNIDECTSQLALGALELLKEHEPVPAIQREVMHMLFWCCGSCGVGITHGDKFCRMCGKPVKWK